MHSHNLVPNEQADLNKWAGENKYFISEWTIANGLKSWNLQLENWETGKTFFQKIISKHAISLDTWV